MDSLGGKNTARRGGGVGSSPAPSTRKKLRDRLRKYDRKISELEKEANDPYVLIFRESHYIKICDRMAKLDKKRKQTRLRLKGYDV